ncbi:segregation/condensation protein A [Streptomyces sp. NPDC094448]|uniref:segregation and condensation protein A n=1 Tax=Streptomyces sp. NPDC094448 TaxID=3366063 RepID=UPI0037F44946
MPPAAPPPRPSRRPLGRGPATPSPPSPPVPDHHAGEGVPDRSGAGPDTEGVSPAPGGADGPELPASGAVPGERESVPETGTTGALSGAGGPPTPQAWGRNCATSQRLGADAVSPHLAGREAYGPVRGAAANAGVRPGNRADPAEATDPAESAESARTVRDPAAAAPDSPRDRAAAPETPPGAPPPADGRFTVRLTNFEGPFDLLLQLISRHKMDVTEVALSKVTNEFMAHIRAMGDDWDLDQTTEFLVVAATLLDLKAARLLPAAEVEDEADLALLEARDLLFARLLQYRAYKRIAEIFGERMAAEALCRPRTVGLEDRYAELLPDVMIGIGAEGFARLAVKAMQPRPRPQVYVDHIHAPLVSVREQAEYLVAVLRERGETGFRELTADTTDTLTVVARFLALLELYRDRAVALEQEEALGELLVRWTGGDAAPKVTDEFDRPAPQADRQHGRKTEVTA